jgi:hypothetical protein
MGNAPSATRWRAHSRIVPTNAARFMTCVRLPHRVLPPTSMPRKNAHNTAAGCVRLNGLEKGGQTQKPRQCAAPAWQSGAPSPMMGNRHWMLTDSKWKSGCGPSTTRSGGSRKQGASRRTEPMAAARANRTDGDGAPLAPDPTSGRLGAPGRSRARQCRAACCARPEAGGSATATALGRVGRTRSRRGTRPERHGQFLGRALPLLPRQRSASDHQ